MPKIIIDIWGGELSMDLVARFIRDFDDAIEISLRELRAGFLVNLRGELAHGDFEEFDSREERLQ